MQYFYFILFYNTYIYTRTISVASLNKYEENNAVFEGAWIDAPHPLASGGNLKLALIPGAKATFSFSGDSVDVISTKGPIMGSIGILIDGVYKGNVSLNDPNYLFQQTVAAYTGLGTGSHTLEIVSASGLIVIDAIKAAGLASSPTHFSETAAAYSSNWVDAPHSLFTETTSKMSPGALGDTATFNFTGTKVRIIGLKGPIFGIADILIDGSPYATVDLYQSGFTIQSTIETISGLSPGSHTVKVVATGTNNPLSAAGLINVDGFDVW